MKFDIEQIWIDDDVRDEALVKDIVRSLKGVPVLEGQEAAEAKRELTLEHDPFTRGKKILRLMRHNGAFLKPCPGTPEYVCCGLEILHIGQGCPMDCRYCALQAYFNRPVIEVFVNIDDLWDALQAHLAENPQRFHRICTGEFTDSLALDSLTGLAALLVEFFSRWANASLELKTKTDCIDPLFKKDPRGRTVLSFSVNSRRIAAADERGAASLEKRFLAAGRAQNRGYAIGFHFDPIIPVGGWEDDYCSIVDSIFARVEPQAIAWISLGVLRFVPSLKEIVRSRLGLVDYFYDGFAPGRDGKSRLPAQRRIAVYQRLADRIRGHSPDTCIYLCMESPYVWERALGIRMESDEDLSVRLDRAAKRTASTL